MSSSPQIISVSKCTLDHRDVDKDGEPFKEKKDGYILDITFTIPRELAKPFCNRSHDEILGHTAADVARAEDVQHARYGSMLRMIKGSKAEALSEDDKTRLINRSGFEDVERNRRIEAGVENSIAFSGAMEIKRRIVEYFQKSCPAIPGHTAQGYPPGAGKPFEVGVRIPLKDAPREVLDLAAIFEEGGKLTQNVTLKDARAEADIAAAPPSQSFNRFMIGLQEHILTSPAQGGSKARPSQDAGNGR